MAEYTRETLSKLSRAELVNVATKEFVHTTQNMKSIINDLLGTRRSQHKMYAYRYNADYDTTNSIGVYTYVQLFKMPLAAVKELARTRWIRSFETTRLAMVEAIISRNPVQ